REMEPSGATDIKVELISLLGRARRRGFRNVVVNHKVIGSHLGPEVVYPTIRSENRSTLRMHIPEDDKVALWFNGMPQIALERVLSGVYSPESLSDRRMLLDCRGMSAIHNGTSHAMIGLLEGLQRQALNWRIEVLIGREAAEFFDFETRYPWWGLHYDTPVGTYAVAIMLNQPWGYTRVRELHEHALINVYNMLDTISWDIMYSSDDHLE